MSSSLGRSKVQFCGARSYKSEAATLMSKQFRPVVSLTGELLKYADADICTWHASMRVCVSVIAYA